MSDVAVTVDNVSKKYCRSLKRGIVYSARDIASSTLGIRQDTSALRPGEFWSLQNVEFELRRGESLGLIGANGAGKSTLLKLLNGIVRPDVGRIRIQGRVGAMIEVGAGFHPLLSGRENIYINGTILGMTKRELDRKIDSILDFSDLDASLLDAPVKTYSSGQYVRLGFAIAAHAEPDVLLIDEVLAVGDHSFVSKCYRRIRELRASGATIILVSHSLPQIDTFCTKGLLLHNGQVVEYGPVQQATTRMRQLMADGTVQRAPNLRSIAQEQIAVTSVTISGHSGSDVPNVAAGSNTDIDIEIHAAKPLESGTVIVYVQRVSDRLVITSGYLKIMDDLPALTSGQITLRVPILPSPGEYELGVAICGESRVDRMSQKCTRILIVPGPRATEHEVGDILAGACIVPLEVVGTTTKPKIEPKLVVV